MVWPKLTVANYPEMLRKLSASVFLVTTACVWLLRIEIAPIDQALRSFDISQVKLLGEFPVPSGTVTAAFLIAVLSESVKLHDKVSRLFQVRSAFDYRWILVPMALCASATIGRGQLRRLAVERDRLMAEVFYKYVSGSNNPEIDKHLVTQALTAWSWYWICVEAIAVIIPTALILAYYNLWQCSTLLLGVVILLQLIMKSFRAEASKYAEAEVDAILADADRQQRVKAVFNAL